MHEVILKFWFEELDAKQWWVKDEKLDATICERFGKLNAQAARCELFEWRESAAGRLAEIIVLDQFSRNIYRDRPESFANDHLALALAQVAISEGADQALPSDRRAFLYMPFMHSESLVIHERAVELFSSLDTDFNLKFEYKHKAIIERFGRYPHRNAILGRESTAAELEFLAGPDSSF